MNNRPLYIGIALVILGVLGYLWLTACVPNSPTYDWVH